MDFSPRSANRKVLNQDFYDEQYTDFRNWYFTNHTPEQIQNFKLQYYDYLEIHQILQPFPLWFKNHVGIPISQINVLDQKNWVTTDGNMYTSIHPPAKSLELLPSDTTSSQPFVISPFMEPPPKSSNALTVKEFIPVIKQNNYTNLYCQTMGKQLTRIEETVVHLKEHCQIQPIKQPHDGSKR